MKLLIILSIAIFSSASFACSCVQGFVSAVHYDKEVLVSKHFKIERQKLNSMELISERDRNTIAQNAIQTVLFPLSIAFYLTAGDCERSCSKGSKAVGVIKYKVDYINNFDKRCTALVKIKGKVNWYGNDYKRVKVKTLKKVCEI